MIEGGEDDGLNKEAGVIGAWQTLTPLARHGVDRCTTLCRHFVHEIHEIHHMQPPISETACCSQKDTSQSPYLPV